MRYHLLLPMNMNKIITYVIYTTKTYSYPKYDEYQSK